MNGDGVGLGELQIGLPAMDAGDFHSCNG
jgi:hypothetical protein